MVIGPEVISGLIYMPPTDSPQMGGEIGREIGGLDITCLQV